jgi:hypothetical protein
MYRQVEPWGDNRSSKLVILRAAGIGLARRRVANN